MPHAKVELYDLVKAVRDALAAITDSVVLANETLLEGIADRRTIHVLPGEFEGAKGSRTDRNTMGGGLRLRRYTVKVFVFSYPRSQVAEGLVATSEDIYSVIAILEAQNTSPPFGLSGVHTFHWSGMAAELTYGDVKYNGSEFTLEFLCH